MRWLHWENWVSSYTNNPRSGLDTGIRPFFKSITTSVKGLEWKRSCQWNGAESLRSVKYSSRGKFFVENGKSILRVGRGRFAVFGKRQERVLVHLWFITHPLSFPSFHIVSERKCADWSNCSNSVDAALGPTVPTGLPTRQLQHPRDCFYMEKITGFKHSNLCRTMWESPTNYVCKRQKHNKPLHGPPLNLLLIISLISHWTVTLTRVPGDAEQVND